MTYSNAPSVTAGEVIAYRLFDVAYAVDLARAEDIWLRSRGATGARKRLSVTPAKAVDYDVPPLLVTLDPVAIELENVSVLAGVTVRLYDFGVISLALTFAANGLGWSEYSLLLNAVNAAIGPGSGHSVWSRLADEMRILFAGALERPSQTVLEEDYLIGRVKTFDRLMTSMEIQKEIDLIPLLSGDSNALSEGARDDLLRQRFSYYTDDFVVLTWDRAFIYEPRGESDVMDVLEVANAQLLEMRYYDELLDDELPRMYDLVETTRRTSTLLSSRRFAGLARGLYTLVAEVTELTEKVDNALQVTEDVYLARIYSAALDLFRVRVVSAAVDRKLAIIRDTYAALYDEASSGRAAVMELAVVILIVIELALAALRR